MSKPKKIKKNPDLEPAIKADSDKAVKTEPKETKETKETKGTKNTQGTKPTKSAKSPIDRLCAQTEDADFEGEIEFTEEDLNAVTPDENGRKIFEFYQLDEPEEKFEDWIYIELPIMNNELAMKNDVYVMLVVPYLFKLPLSEVKQSEIANEDTACIVIGEIFLAVTQKTLEEYSKAMRYIGFGNGITKIDDNEDALNKLVDLAKEGQVRPNGYYEDLMEYWYAGEVYHEKDVIWFDLESLSSEEEDEDAVIEEIGPNQKRVNALILNFDVLHPIHTSIDISEAKGVTIEYSRRVLTKEQIKEVRSGGESIGYFESPIPNEEVWYLATKKAEEVEKAGFAVVCLRGKFYVPVETMINHYTCELEEYISVFNVANCHTSHHKCIGMIIADVGNMQVCTGVRYLKGRHFDWKKRIEQEAESYRIGNPDFYYFGDPYDSSSDPYGDFDFLL